MSNFIFGRYIPGDSYIHKMNPISKLILSFFFVLIILFANNWQTYLILMGVSYVAILFSNISLRVFLRGIKPLLFLILFMAILQIFFSSSGNVLFALGPLSITDMGLINSGFIFIRFILIIVITTLLTLSTSSSSIADGIGIILSPLRKIKVPVQTISLMVSVALRFVPTLVDELSTIIKAQKSRGVNFNEGSVLQRLKKFITILVPLFFTTFDHAEKLSYAMMARGYRTNATRSKYRSYHWHLWDTMSWIVYLICIILIFILRS